jgi:uncharacterized protein YjbI with pentapeptide repeats
MASMAGANLSEANLLNADAGGAILPDAVLRGANLTGANLSNATLFQANFGEALLLDANLTGALLSTSSRHACHADPATIGYGGANVRKGAPPCPGST